MKLSIQPSKKKTFSQRFVRVAIFWGIPVVCLEFIGIPRSSWGIVLVLVLPATLVGVLAGAAIEHFLVSALAKENEAK